MLPMSAATDGGVAAAGLAPSATARSRAQRCNAMAAYARARGLPPSTIIFLSGGVTPDCRTAPTAATSAVSAVAQGFVEVVGGGVELPPLLLLLLLLPPHAAIATDPMRASKVARKRNI